MKAALLATAAPPPELIFFVGLHRPSHAGQVEFACISINVLRDRVGPFMEPSAGWMMDSGAFTEVSKHGCYRTSPAEFAADAARWVSLKLLCVVSQDYMCEPVVLKRTGLTVEEHQRLTVERFDALSEAWDLERAKRGWPDDWPPIMPVLQGWTVEDYLRHMDMYGDRLKPGMWVGVGSVCKRQGNVAVIEAILLAIAARRPDLRLHGFGVKLTALRSFLVRILLATADSMAWSFHAKAQAHEVIRALEKETGTDLTPSQANVILLARGEPALPDANSVKEALAYVQRVQAIAA